MAIDRRLFLGGLAALGLPLPAFGASPRSDPEWIRLLLTTLHPGLYRYQTPAQFERRMGVLARAWAARPGVSDRFLALSRLTAAIRCGHSHANPYNQSDQVIAALTDGRALLPFRFRWIAGQMVVTDDDPHRVGLAPGTTVEQVDRLPAAAMLSALLPLARADGHNDAKRRALMAVRGDDEFEEFDLFQPLLFPLGREIRLALRHADGRRENRTVASIQRPQRLAMRKPAPKRGSDEPAWTFERRGKVALLTMPSWALYDSKWDWQSWLDRHLTAIAGDGTRGLVLDLRANEGGQDCGDALIARLSAVPVPVEGFHRLARFREVPADLRAPLDTWDKGFFRLGKDGTPAPGGYVALPAADSGGSNVIAPKGPRFAGKVAVLVGPTNSSATFQFAQRIQTTRLAILIGEPTGGNCRGINGGAYFFVRLPDSGLEFDLPLIGYFPGRPQPDAGILPDVAVPLTAAALAARRDEALEKALALVG